MGNRLLLRWPRREANLAGLSGVVMHTGLWDISIAVAMLWQRTLAEEATALAQQLKFAPQVTVGLAELSWHRRVLRGLEPNGPAASELHSPR